MELATEEAMVMTEAEQKIDLSKSEGQQAVVGDVQEDEDIVP